MLRWLATCLVVFLLACGAAAVPQGFPVIGDAPPGQPDDAYRPQVPEVRVETYVSGLEVPWSIVFLPDGRALVSERPGRIRLVREGRLAPQPWAVVEVHAGRGESGLMGLAVHPQFPEEPWIYAMYTYRDGGQIVNRVSRFRDGGERGVEEEVVVDGILGGTNHDGGRIAFGPDGKLYVGTGEAFQKERAQDLEDLGGKVLRVEADGSVPADNPFAGSPVWSLGHRNVQGLAWHPTTGALFNSEHGPSGERWTRTDGSQASARAHDEVNVMTAGGNAGWPDVVGYGGVEDYVDPILVWPDAAAPPGGMTFYTGDLLPALRGDLFLATLRSEALVRVRFQDGGEPHRPTAVERWFAEDATRGAYGRLRDVVQGPDGALYVLTSNRDGRRRGAGPAPEDDRVLRIVPDAS